MTKHFRMVDTSFKDKLIIRFFAVTEILIGGITFIAVILSLIQGDSVKPLEVLIFVLATSSISTGIGFGLLRHNLTSYHLLLYFSSIVILSKILIFAKIITLNGALEKTVPSSIKNIISIIYHTAVICYFARQPIKEIFKRGQDAAKE